MDLSQWEWTCACCGRKKRGVPDFGFDAPIHHDWADGSDTDFRVLSKDSDTCRMEIAGQRCFFIRCVLQIPVRRLKTGQKTGRDSGLGFGIWASLSEPSFQRYAETYSSPDQSLIGPLFGYIANRLPAYPDTLNLKADVIPQDDRQRPLLSLWDENAGHPLYTDQAEGIGPTRLTTLLSEILPCDGRA